MPLIWHDKSWALGGRYKTGVGLGLTMPHPCTSAPNHGVHGGARRERRQPTLGMMPRMPGPPL